MSLQDYGHWADVESLIGRALSSYVSSNTDTHPLRGIKVEFKWSESQQWSKTDDESQNVSAEDHQPTTEHESDQEDGDDADIIGCLDVTITIDPRIRYSYLGKSGRVYDTADISRTQLSNYVLSELSEKIAQTEGLLHYQTPQWQILANDCLEPAWERITRSGEPMWETRLGLYSMEDMLGVGEDNEQVDAGATGHSSSVESRYVDEALIITEHRAKPALQKIVIAMVKDAGASLYEDY